MLGIAKLMRPSFREIPVLLIFFNRPDVLKKNLLALRSISPRYLFLASDGARPDVMGDNTKVVACRELVLKYVDWDCVTHTYYSNCNMGCDIWVPEAISWFFDQVMEGIILEDDCIIGKEFALFSERLLREYRINPKVMNVSAANFQEKRWGEASYYFSNYPANWGWATWRSSWNKFSSGVTLDEVEHLIASEMFESRLCSERHKRYWSRFFRGLASGKYTFWDAKWLFAIWKSNGLSITPNMNLVRNVGFGVDATHTKSESEIGAMRLETVDDPLVHPESILVSGAADDFIFNKRYAPTLRKKIRNVIGRMFK